MGDYLFYAPHKYRKKDTPAFRSIRKIRRCCQKCNALAVAIMNGEVLCGRHADYKREEIKSKWRKVKR